MQCADNGVYVRCPQILSDYFAMVVSAVIDAGHEHGMHAIVDVGNNSGGSVSSANTVTYLVSYP